MLLNLCIQNYILIEKIECELTDGFSVFTGETGAGKSLFVDAMMFLSGARSNADVIGHNGNKALVEAVFEVNNSVGAKLIDLGLKSEDDDYVVISREISRSNRSIARVNHRVVNLAVLKEIMSRLVDIHSQHETQKILNPSNQRLILDNFGNNQELILEYNAAYDCWNTSIRELEIFNESELSDFEMKKLEEKIEFIEAFKPTLEDYELCKLDLKKLTDFERTQRSFEHANSVLNKENLVGNLYTVLDDLKFIYPDLHSDIDDIYYKLEDLSQSLSQDFEMLTFDQNELDALQERIYQYERLFNEYKDIDGINSFIVTATTKINSKKNREDIVVDLTNEVEKAYLALKKQGQLLYNARLNAARVLEKKMVEQLNDLFLKDAKLKIHIDHLDEPMHSGFDSVHFNVSMNKGLEPRPIERVASGGELSRLMLALKVILADSYGIDTVIFDEIDTGVSGIVGKGIGSKMKMLSRNLQVISITHLAPVAAYSTSHYVIEKRQQNDHVTTNIRKLSDVERVEEISKIMFGNLDATSLEAANALFVEAQS